MHGQLLPRQSDQRFPEVYLRPCAKMSVLQLAALRLVMWGTLNNAENRLKVLGRTDTFLNQSHECFPALRSQQRIELGQILQKTWRRCHPHKNLQVVLRIRCQHASSRPSEHYYWRNHMGRPQERNEMPITQPFGQSFPLASLTRF